MYNSRRNQRDSRERRDRDRYERNDRAVRDDGFRPRFLEDNRYRDYGEGQSRPVGISSVTCYTCHKPGHISPHCPTKQGNAGTPGNKFADFEKSNPGAIEEFMRSSAEKKAAAARAQELQVITDAVTQANANIFAAIGGEVPISSKKRPLPDLTANSDASPPRKSIKSTSKPSPSTLIRSLSQKIDERTNFTPALADLRRSLSQDLRSEMRLLLTPSPTARHYGDDPATPVQILRGSEYVGDNRWNDDLVLPLENRSTTQDTLTSKLATIRQKNQNSLILRQKYAVQQQQQRQFDDDLRRERQLEKEIEAAEAESIKLQFENEQLLEHQRLLERRKKSDQENQRVVQLREKLIEVEIARERLRVKNARLEQSVFRADHASTSPVEADPNLLERYQETLNDEESMYEREREATEQMRSDLLKKPRALRWEKTPWAPPTGGSSEQIDPSTEVANNSVSTPSNASTNSTAEFRDNGTIDVSADSPLPQREKRVRGNNARGQLGEDLNDTSEKAEVTSIGDIAGNKSDHDVEEDDELKSAVEQAARIARARVIYISKLRDKDTASRKQWRREIIKEECKKHKVKFNAKHMEKTCKLLSEEVHK